MTSRRTGNQNPIKEMRQLERQNENTGNGTYEDMVLYDTGGRRIEEAVEVLTDQSGFTDFL